jgi:CHASE1-domain containing sensor protein
MTAAVGLHLREDRVAKAEADFAGQAALVANDIQLAFVQTFELLKGTRGVFASGRNLARSDFRAYVASRDLANDFVGVRGVGFIQRVMRQDLAAFVAAERGDNAPQFTLRQLEDKNEEILYITRFIEPAASNTGAMGLDMGSHPVRREALQRAVDSGEPVMSGAVRLEQDSLRRQGVLLFLPVYANGSRTATVAERRAALVGLVFAPVVVADLIDPVQRRRADQVRFSLDDDTSQKGAGQQIFGGSADTAGIVGSTIAAVLDTAERV